MQVLLSAGQFILFRLFACLSWDDGFCAKDLHFLCPLPRHTLCFVGCCFYFVIVCFVSFCFSFPDVSFYASRLRTLMN